MSKRRANEVVIIGGGVAGLSAAIYSRIAGNEVLVLEKGTSVGGKAAGIGQSGFQLDPGPSIIILKELYEQLFRDAGRKMEDYLQFERLDPISRVCFEGIPAFDLPASREGCERVVRDLDAQDGARFVELMRQMDKVAPLIDRTIFKRPFDQAYHLLDPKMIMMSKHLDVRHAYRPSVDKMFQSPVLRAFFYGFPSYSGQSYDSVAPGAFLLPYLMIEQGVYYPKGGVAAIPRALERLALELGVVIRLHSDVAAIKVEGRRVVGVSLADDSTISASHIICAADRLTCQAWLGRTVTMPPSYSYFTVHWGLKKRWKSLQHHTLLIPKEFEKGFEMLYRKREFPNPPIIYLNETSKMDPFVAPEGCSNLFAVITSPAEEPHLNWNVSAPEYKALVREQMAEFGVEFSDSEIVFERTQTPTYFRTAHGSYRGSLYGPDEKFRLFGMMPLRNFDEQLSNLFYCGGSVQPGAGLPMVLLSGKFAAGKIR